MEVLALTACSLAAGHVGQSFVLGAAADLDFLLRERERGIKELHVSGGAMSQSAFII